MSLVTFALLGLLGGFVGFLAGLFGIGGGLVLTPFLTFFLSYNHLLGDNIVVHVAIATSLSTIVVTSLSSLLAHARQKGISWRAFWQLLPGILAGGFLGSKISSSLPTIWLAIVFSGFMFFSAYKMFVGKKKKGVSDQVSDDFVLPAAPVMVGLGLLIGTIASLVGAGGGFITVPILTMLGVPLLTAIGTSAALGFPIAVSGSIGYIIQGLNIQGLLPFPEMLGLLYLPAALSVVVVSVFTAPLGAKTAHRMNTTLLRRLFAVLLLALGVYMLYKGYRSL